MEKKSEERRFVDLIIILMLHCGNEFLKQVLSFGFKLDAIVTSIWKHYKNWPFRNSWNYFFWNIKIVQKRFYSLLYNS